MEERQKTLKSNERKTVRETCKMKKATCGQFRVHERNFTCTVATSPSPSALAALSCEQTVLQHLPPETNVAQDTQDHPTPAGRAVKNNIDTNKGGLWNSGSKQKRNL